jgi:hypothetical protein
LIAIHPSLLIRTLFLLRILETRVFVLLKSL